jgi:type I restriction-modification system DNA methylase subunit
MSKTNRLDINSQVEALLQTRIRNQEAFTVSDIEILQQYTGSGGLQSEGIKKRGILYEYYTPIPIVEKMWGLAYKHGFINGHILEPACGTGRFLKYIDWTNNTCDAFEFSKDDRTGFLVAKYSFPEANVVNDYFESIFYQNNVRITKEPCYDLVIGNPPYGAFTGYYAGKNREGKHTKSITYDQYFIEKGIELLVPNGILCFIVPSTLMDNDLKYNDWKKNIAEMADLVDAYRLPANVFTHTQIQTDILVFRKK